jgi:hypothetical protein
MLRTLIVAAGVALAASATGVLAQVATFPDAVQPTLPSNELLVTEIGAALPASDLNSLTSAAAASVPTGELLVQQLQNAFALAPDDAARSRIAGVLTHTQAALASLRQATAETTLDAARGRLEQARGEAQESLNELRPVVVAQPAPVALPAAGTVASTEMAAAPVLGMSLVLLGLMLRFAAPRPR